MATLSYDNMGISALAACVPSHVMNNYEYINHFSAEEVKLVVDKIGVYQRRFADSGTCSSDLCYKAAEKLITDNKVNRDEIDLIVFVSQTPDYRMPATSTILQDRLGLATNTISIDLSLGCSGFIYGLSLVYAMMERSNLRKALLLNGETRSRIYSPKDRTSAFLFGDAGVAALIDKNAGYGKSFFSLNSDGSKADLIKIKAGGYRFPTTTDTMQEKIVDEFGNIRSDEHGYMKGGDVFNFVIKEVPADINRILSFSGNDLSKIDYFVFHQANLVINNYLVKKLKLNSEKVPSIISKFGNTSSTSIPLTIISELKEKISNTKLLMSGFGVGMTWASCVIDTYQCRISEIVEY